MRGLRFKFIRGEEVKYISHLDLMRTFERALRRSGMPVSYSRGFNPHPLLVFGLPLPVGVTSEAEYADIELDEYVNPKDFIDRINLTLPEGLKLTDAREKKSGSNIMASIVQASYRIAAACYRFCYIEEIQELVEALLRKNEIIVEKHGRQDGELVNIRPLIKDLQAEKFEDRLESDGKKDRTVCFYAVLSAGSRMNLNPNLLMAGINKVAGEMMTGQILRTVKIHRTALYAEYKGRIADPLDI